MESVSNHRIPQTGCYNVKDFEMLHQYNTEILFFVIIEFLIISIVLIY